MNYFPVGENGKVKVATEKVKISELEIWKKSNEDQLLPYPPTAKVTTKAVEYKGCLHLFTSDSHHLKFDNGVWSEASAPPERFDAVVVYNDEIHAFNGTNIGQNYYKWDGTTWSRVGNGPSMYKVSSAVLYNNEIHAFGGGTDQTSHYKWDGTTWSRVSTIPWPNLGDRLRAATLDGAIYLFTWSNYTSYNGAKWDGTTWTEIPVSNISCLAGGNVLVFDNAIHVLGYYDAKSSPAKEHYIATSNGTGLNWTRINDLPAKVSYGAVAVYKKKIHTISEKHHRLDAEQYFLVVNQP